MVTMVNFLQHHELHLDMVHYRNFTRKPVLLVIYERPDAGQPDLTVQVQTITDMNGSVVTLSVCNAYSILDYRKHLLIFSQALGPKKHDLWPKINIYTVRNYLHGLQNSGDSMGDSDLHSDFGPVTW